MSNTIILKHGKENLIPELEWGEPAFASDTRKFFIGCGFSQRPVCIGPDNKDIKSVQVVVGTTNSGHTLDDCDYLCTGEYDEKVIQEAINSIWGGVSLEDA